MPLDRFVLILVIVIAAAAVTVWVGATFVGAFSVGPSGVFFFLPVALIAYVVWRVVSDRIRSREDDHYDRIEK